MSPKIKLIIAIALLALAAHACGAQPSNPQNFGGTVDGLEGTAQPTAAEAEEEGVMPWLVVGDPPITLQDFVSCSKTHDQWVEIKNKSTLGGNGNTCQQGAWQGVTGSDGVVYDPTIEEDFNVLVTMAP